MIQMPGFPQEEAILRAAMKSYPLWHCVWWHWRIRESTLEESRIVFRPTGTFLFPSCFTFIFILDFLFFFKMFCLLKAVAWHYLWVTPLEHIMCPINFQFSSLPVLVIWKYTPVFWDPGQPVCSPSLLNHLFLEKRLWFSYAHVLKWLCITSQSSF